MRFIEQLNVFNQNESGGVLGRDGCGINTFKNVLLSLLLEEGHISQQQFSHLSNSGELVYDIYDAVKDIIAKRDGNGKITGIDVTITEMFKLFEMAKAGKIDLSNYGIAKNMMDSLVLSREGKQNVSIVNMGDYCGYGSFGMEEDLLAASVLVQLARMKDKFCHAFAIGYNNEHWMTVILHQDEHGKKQWQFMDSYRNQSLYKNILVNKIEEVLNKSERELKNYLIGIYDACSDLIDRRFKFYFNSETNMPIEDKKEDWDGNGRKFQDAKEFYIDDETNRKRYLNYISNRFVFMENADWLKKDIGREELQRVRRLYAITKFMIGNGAEAHPEIKDKLSPIAVRLGEVEALNISKDQTQLAQNSSKEKSQHKFTKMLETISMAAIMAIKHSQPKKISGLCKESNRVLEKGLDEVDLAIIKPITQSFSMLSSPSKKIVSLTPDRQKAVKLLTKLMVEGYPMIEMRKINEDPAIKKEIKDLCLYLGSQLIKNELEVENNQTNFLAEKSRFDSILQLMYQSRNFPNFIHYAGDLLQFYTLCCQSEIAMKNLTTLDALIASKTPILGDTSDNLFITECLVIAAYNDLTTFQETFETNHFSDEELKKLSDFLTKVEEIKGRVEEQIKNFPDNIFMYYLNMVISYSYEKTAEILSQIKENSLNTQERVVLFKAKKSDLSSVASNLDDIKRIQEFTEDVGKPYTPGLQFSLGRELLRKLPSDNLQLLTKQIADLINSPSL